MTDYTPTTLVVKHAVTFERERLGEPRPIKSEAFDRWLKQVKAEAWHEGYGQALNALQAVLDLHKPVDVEPSETICSACSNRLPNGRFMPTVEYPCPTVETIQDAIRQDQP